MARRVKERERGERLWLEDDTDHLFGVFIDDQVKVVEGVVPFGFFDRTQNVRLDSFLRGEVYIAGHVDLGATVVGTGEYGQHWTYGGKDIES